MTSIFDNSILKSVTLSPIYQPYNQHFKALAPLVKEKNTIGFIEVIGKNKYELLSYDLILAGQYIVRAMIANEKKMAIESLVELNNELEKIVEDKTNSLLREKESNFHASRMATLGEIAAGIAHEINNPLTVIQSKVLKIEKKLKAKNALESDTAEDLQKIVTTIHRIAKIIKGLKFVSRDGQHDPPAKVSLGDLFQTTLDMCAERLKNNNVDLIIEASGEDYEIEVRETQLVQVFLNLIHNSYDAIKNSEAKWIKIQYHLQKELLLIRFKDSGNGIPEDILKKIMDPFFTTKPVGHGTGLGLSISKGIIENHSGKLYYNPKASNTEFIIEIPYVRKITSTPKSA